jgi:hypothetical protein
VREVFEEMSDEVAYRFFWIEVLLAALAAVAIANDGAAVQTSLIVAKVMAHGFLFF